MISRFPGILNPTFAIYVFAFSARELYVFCNPIMFPSRIV